jgi:hypothetical protein
VKLASVLELKRQLGAEVAAMMDAQAARDAAVFAAEAYVGRLARPLAVVPPPLAELPPLYRAAQVSPDLFGSELPKAVRRQLAATSVPTLALGVAPGRRRGDYYLGVRVQGRGPAARKLAEAAKAKARGECDVRIVPKVVARAARPARWFRAQRRPLEAGLSVGLAAYEDTGTIGAVVEDARAYYVLSNNHVLGDLNRARRGDPVVQPGGYYRTPSKRTLAGYVDRFEPLSFTRANSVDCAIAAILCDIEFYAGWNEAIRDRVIGTREVTRDDLDRPVVKVGSTTGITRGRITQFGVDTLRVDFGPRQVARFEGQFEVTGDDGRPFSAEGDSGSLIVDPRSRRALGLLCCGGPDENDVDLTYANPIDAVLSALDVRLTTR